MTDERFRKVKAAVESWVKENQEGSSVNQQALRRYIDRQMPGHDIELKSGTNSADVVVDDDLGIKLITDLNKYKTGNVGRQFKLHAETNDYLLVLGALDDSKQSTWSYLTSNYDARTLGLKALDYVASFAKRTATNTSDAGHERPMIDSPKPALLATLTLLLLVGVTVVAL